MVDLNNRTLVSEHRNMDRCDPLDHQIKHLPRKEEVSRWLKIDPEVCQVLTEDVMEEIVKLIGKGVSDNTNHKSV